MKQGDKLFVRIDFKNETPKRTEQDLQDHIKYVNKIASERYFIAGSFTDTHGGMIIFAANDYKEAKSLMDKDPIIERGFYRYELHEWNLLIVSPK